MDGLRFKNRQRFLWLGLALLFLGVFVKVTWELHEGPELESLDREILVLISTFRTPALNGPAVDITALGSPSVIGLFTLIAVSVLGLNRDRRGAAYLALGSTGAGISTFLLKRLATRERPSVVTRLVEVSGYSYPSGHSLAATSFYLLLMFLAWRHFFSWKSRFTLFVFTGLLIGGVCFSRLYLGVHYPSDVLSGICLGAAWVLLLTAYFSGMNMKKKSSGLGILALFGMLCVSAHSSYAETSFSPSDFSDFQMRWNNTIPFPPESLADSLLGLDQGSHLHAAIFPHGRSLERANTDYRFPRTVMAWRNSATSAPYFLFVGYTPKMEQLEIMSWNWKTRQFDFGLVVDYAEGKTPRYLDANRQGCIACHQSRVPIFPVSPWSETPSNDQVHSRILAETVDPFARFWLKKDEKGNPQQSLSSGGFNLFVGDAARLVQMQSFCTNACGGDLLCRKQILETAVLEARHEVRSDYFSPEEIRARSMAMSAVWPSDGFKISSPEMLDRVLGADETKLAPYEDPLRLRDLDFGLTPATATSAAVMQRYRSCWNFSDSQIQELKSYDRAALKKAMNSDAIIQLVKTWLPAEEAILATLHDASMNPTPISGSTLQMWTPPFEEPRIVSHPERPRRSTTALFESYCMQCHGGSENAAPPGLPLSSISGLRSYIGTAGRTVREVLDPNRQLMPPLGSVQPSREELQQMLSEVQ